MKNRKVIQLPLNKEDTSPPISNKQNLFDGKNDSEVWEAFCKGNNLAFSHIYKKYAHLLFKYGCQFTQDRDLIQDCIQSLFLEVRTRESRPETIVSIKSYLLRALYRILMRSISKERKFLGLFSSTPQPNLNITISPEKNIIGRELVESQVKFLQKAISNLTRKQREAIIYYFYEGMSYQEIAYIMDMKKVHSARKLIYKALDELKSDFKKQNIDFSLSIIPLLSISFMESKTFLEIFS